jgi:hypothetical protein
MTREDIIRMAREAELTGLVEAYTIGNFERFAALVAEAEREACAKVCETGVDTEHPIVKGHIMRNFGGSKLLAKAIRARGSK